MSNLPTDAVAGKYRTDLINYILHRYAPATRLGEITDERKAKRYHYLIGSLTNQEGLFLILDELGFPGVLTREIYRVIVQESIMSKLANRFHVFAEHLEYEGAGVQFHRLSEL